MADRLLRGLVGAKRALVAACLLGYLLLVLLSGGSLGGLFWFWACLLAYLWLPGRLFSTLSGAEKLLGAGAQGPLAILLGTGFFCALYCFCRRLELLPLLQLLPPLLAGCQLLAAWRAARLRRKAGQAAEDPFWRLWQLWQSGTGLWYLLLFAALTLLFALTVSVKNARPAAVDGLLPNQDLMWNIGNANSFKIAFPPQDIRFSQVRLSYHYLTEMTEGALSLVSGLPAWDIVAFYMGPAVLAALLCCLQALGELFFEGDRRRAAAFVFGLFLFNCASMGAALLDGRGLFWNYNLSYLITNLNAQATALIFVSIFILLFTGMARRGFAVGPRYLAVFFGSAVLLCFAKGPVAAVTVCSFAITMLLVLLRRPRPRLPQALAALAGVVGLFGLVYTTFYASGVNTSVRLGLKTFEQSVLDPLLGAIWRENIYLWRAALPVAAVVLLFCMLPLQFTLYLRGLWQDVKNIFRLPAERLLVNGAAAGGALAYFIFWHPSYSQIYFVLYALFCMNLLAPLQLGRPARRWFKRLCCLLGAVGLCTTAVLVVNFTGSGGRQLLRNLRLIPRYPYGAIATAADEAAAGWLGQNLDPGQRFATNRVNTFPESREGVSCIYTALSGRQAFMEGYTYAVTNMGVSEKVLQEKQRVNAAFFSAGTTREELLALAEENGVDYLVYAAAFPGQADQLAGFPLVFEADGVQIYRLCPPAQGDAGA